MIDENGTFDNAYHGCVLMRGVYSVQSYTLYYGKYLFSKGRLEVHLRVDNVCGTLTIGTLTINGYHDEVLRFFRRVEVNSNMTATKSKYQHSMPKCQ